MKKILAMLLVLVMALGLASSALAVSWAAPAISTSASPFAAEVIKLGVNGDITGAKYYTVLTDAAAYNYSNIYFAVRVTVPSYANANAYYGNSGFLSGNKAKVTVNYTNLDAKGEGTYYIPLTDSSQTLWLNTKSGTFDPSWVTSVNNNCGCGDTHIISGIAKGAQGASVRVCIGASGKLDDILIDGCYKVTEKSYYGVIPCVNCTPVTLNGFLFSGNCAANGVFYAVNSANKVTGVYAVGNCGATEGYFGALKQFDKKLFGWFPDGVMQSCSTGSCGVVKFVKREIPVGAKINSAWTQWDNSFRVSGMDYTQTVAKFDEWKRLPEVNKSSANFLDLYYKDDEGNTELSNWDRIKPSDLSAEPKVVKASSTDSANNRYNDMWWSKNSLNEFAPGSIVKYSTLIDLYNDRVIYEGYVYDVPATSTYTHSYGNLWYVINAISDGKLYRQTSATTVNCDYNDASYLNTLNHLYALLGFTYADVAAGNVYMTKDIILSNFGFSTSVCDTKTWSPYTAAITVTPIAEVPATGSMSYLGFALLILAVSTAAIAKKKVRG